MMSILNNLLNTAFSIIPHQVVQFFGYAGDTNIDGLLIPSYQEPIEVLASVQALSANSRVYLGFDTSKETLRFFLKIDVSIVNGISKKGSSKIAFNGKEYILESTTNWTAIDGWSECVGVYNG